MSPDVYHPQDFLYPLTNYYHLITALIFFCFLLEFIVLIFVPPSSAALFLMT